MKYAAAILFLVLFTFSCKEKKESTEVKPQTKEEVLISEHKLHPDSAIITEDLIQFYRDNGETEKALKLVDQTISSDTANERLYSIKGTLYFEDDDTLAAVKSFENAVRLSPDEDYLISLGTLYAQTKNERSLKIADIILQNFPQSQKEAYFIKGFYYNFTGNKTEAIKYFDKCLEISFTFMQAYREKAICLYDLKKYEQALQTINKALTIQNNYDEGYYYKGLILEKLNRKNEAAEAYEFALMYDPDYTEARNALSKLNNQ